jgi:hypothetical protein
MSGQEPIHEERTFDVSRAVRWLLVLVIALLVIGFATYARGDEHKRGDEVGALAPALRR